MMLLSRLRAAVKYGGSLGLGPRKSPWCADAGMTMATTPWASLGDVSTPSACHGSIRPLEKIMFDPYYESGRVGQWQATRHTDTGAHLERLKAAPVDAAPVKPQRDAPLALARLLILLRAAKPPR